MPSATNLPHNAYFNGRCRVSPLPGIFEQVRIASRVVAQREPSGNLDNLAREPLTGLKVTT